MTLVIKKLTGGKLVMAKTPSNGLDADAAAYIAAVEAADGQALEAGVRWNIDQFVRGCKADGTWTAIKASCILSGARTLAGALVPLVGTAPTNNGFVSGDYNRKTGLKGSGGVGASVKYLNANRNNNVDPQNSKHLACFRSEVATSNASEIGADYNKSGASSLGKTGTIVSTFALNSASLNNVVDNLTSFPGFIGSNRASSTTVTARYGRVNYSLNSTSASPLNASTEVLAINIGGDNQYGSNGRLAFYSIGESLDLALLDARVTTLINSNALVIP